MSNFMTVLEGELTVRGPLFIGDGKSVTKKESIYDSEREKIIIPDLGKMYKNLCEIRKEKAYEQFLLRNPKGDFADWLQQHRIGRDQISQWTKYELECGDAIVDRNTTMQIMSFVKDAYGLPYIPGSSIKGMFRTILLAYDIHLHSKNYETYKATIRNEINRKKKRTQYLSKETNQLEVEGFHRLNRTQKRYNKANDIMAGFRISDSEPLQLSDLILCQKVEYNPEGTSHKLNLLRECLKPETKVRFHITIDTELCRFTKEYIMDAVAWFSSNMYDSFLEKYPNIDRPNEKAVWLGGGVGYVSKTVVYPLFGEKAAETAKIILKNTTNGKNSKRDWKIAPHILKMTQYQGKQYQFGLCDLNISEPIETDTVSL